MISLTAGKYGRKPTSLHPPKNGVVYQTFSPSIQQTVKLLVQSYKSVGSTNIILCVAFPLLLVNSRDTFSLPYLLRQYTHPAPRCRTATSCRTLRAYLGGRTNTWAVAGHGALEDNPTLTVEPLRLVEHESMPMLVLACRNPTPVSVSHTPTRSPPETPF